MAQRNLKPILNDEPKEKRLDFMSMEEIIGRDTTEKLVRNPPKFDDAKVEMYNPGLKWMGVFKLS